MKVLFYNIRQITIDRATRDRESVRDRVDERDDIESISSQEKSPSVRNFN